MNRTRNTSQRRLLTFIVGAALSLSPVAVRTGVSAEQSAARGKGTPQGVASGADRAARSDLAAKAYGKLPLQFEANEGQADERFVGGEGD